MGNTKNLENEKDVKCLSGLTWRCPECGGNSTATGGKTPDGRLPVYRCDSEECRVLFTEEDWLTCPSCHQQGKLIDRVDDGFEVCICENPECSQAWFAGRKVEEVQVSYTSQLTGDEVWDVCPTCGKVGKNTGEVNRDNRILFICENEECPESWYPGRTEELTAEAAGEPPWRNRLDESIKIMEACMAAAVQIIPGDVDPDEEFSAMKYGALCHTRCACAVALFRAVSTETTAVMDAMGKAASVLEGIGKTEQKTAIMLMSPKGLIPVPPEWGKDDS